MTSVKMFRASDSGFCIWLMATLLLGAGSSAEAVETKCDAPGWIPAQVFLMGDGTGGGRQDEQPAHPVTLSRYWLSPHMVTAQEYCEFLNDCGGVKLDGTFIVPKDASHADDTSWGTLVNLAFAPIEQQTGRYAPITHCHFTLAHDATAPRTPKVASVSMASESCARTPRPCAIWPASPRLKRARPMR